MVNIGLIGESPYDTKSIVHLLQQKYNAGFSYVSLLKNITGDQLNTAKVHRAAIDAIAKHKPHVVVVVRDADSPESDHNQIAKRKEWFNNLSKHIKVSNILLLNIYELEALILADIEQVESHYNTKIGFKGNVSHQKDPKEYLKNKTKKYEVSHCPELFKKLRFEIVKKNCKYFSDFIDEFEQAAQ